MAILEVWDDTKGRGACRSCGASLTWFALVSSGKRHPFDGNPVYLRTSHDESTRRLIGELDSKDSHFATCPDSKQWSRAKRS